MFSSGASLRAKASTASEWSTDTSTGRLEFSTDGSTPASDSVLRMAARSTSAGVLVVSCISTRPGWKAISASLVPVSVHARSAARAASFSAPSMLRATFSISRRKTTGKRLSLSLQSAGRSTAR